LPGIAAALLKQAPERPHGWLHLAYSARRATGGGLQAAFDVLRPGGGEISSRTDDISERLAMTVLAIRKRQLLRTMEASRH